MEDDPSVLIEDEPISLISTTCCVFVITSPMWSTDRQTHSVVGLHHYTICFVGVSHSNMESQQFETRGFLLFDNRNIETISPLILV